MPPRKDNRTRLIRAAEKMTFRRGFRQATLADIAREARVPLGNVYYYFKTKDEIGNAIIDRMLGDVRTALESFDAAGSPKDRLYACIDAVLENKAAIVQGGCAIGSLCTELHKERSTLADRATALFDEQLQWMEAQFAACGRRDDARRLAIHLLSALQGVSALAHSFRDPQLVVDETTELKKWVRDL